MKSLKIAVLVVWFTLPPLTGLAYDPAFDQAMVTVLSERIDGDVNQGLLPDDRAALMRAEIMTTQKLVANGDSQATAMLADIDRDLAAYDNTLDVYESGRDLFYHSGDSITIAMRDGVAWRVESVQDTDIMSAKTPGAVYSPGVQGVYLAKQPGYTGLTLVDPASGKHVRFRFYIVDKAAGGT